MPLLPILMKMMGSAAMRGAGGMGFAKSAGEGFTQHYAKDFGEGVKRGLKRDLSGRRDGQNIVEYARAGVKKLFYELPKAIGQRRWGEHMAGALVKVTSERMAAMNASLAAYGGSAQTYAQSMTSLADKAFRLGFGEADWIKSVMKYTLGEYDPFGSGLNGMKTKEENLEWFKTRYDGRKDLIDEARTVGGILGLTPDIVKIILDGHRELLDKESHLTAQQVKDSQELALQSARTQAAWQRVSDVWGANTTQFWKGWEGFKEKIANFTYDVIKGERSEEEVEKDYDERLKGVYDNVETRGLSADDAKNWSGLQYHMTKGEGKNWDDEKLMQFALAQEKAGVGDVETNLAKLLAVRADSRNAYLLSKNAPVSESELEAARVLYASSKVKAAKDRKQYDSWKAERLAQIKKEEIENEKLNPRWFEGAVSIGEHNPDLGPAYYFDENGRPADVVIDLDRLRKNLLQEDVPEEIRNDLGTMPVESLINRWLITQDKGGRTYNPFMKSRHESEQKILDGDAMEFINPFLQQILVPKAPPPNVPTISPNGVSPSSAAAVMVEGGNKTYSSSDTYVVKNVDEALKIQQEKMDGAKNWLDFGAPAPIGSQLLPNAYNGNP